MKLTERKIEGLTVDPTPADREVLTALIVARRHQGRPPSKCAPPRRWTKARHIFLA
jgi:hypothetical protein